MIVSAKEKLSPASVAHLRKVLAEVSAFFDGERSAPEPSAVDAAWMVMEAANDFGDGSTIEACRRVIDASLNGAVAAQSDLATINDYFK